MPTSYMTTYLGNAWRLRDALVSPTVDFTFDVAGVPTISEPDEARIAQTPCGGPPVLESASSTVQPVQIRAAIRINPGPDKATRLATLRSLIAARGPYYLDTPVLPAQIQVVLYGPLTRDLGGDGARTVVVNMQEIS